MVLEVKNVQYSYKSKKEKEILKNVSIQSCYFFFCLPVYFRCCCHDFLLLSDNWA